MSAAHKGQQELLGNCGSWRALSFIIESIRNWDLFAPSATMVCVLAHQFCRSFYQSEVTTLLSLLYEKLTVADHHDDIMWGRFAPKKNNSPPCSLHPPPPLPHRHLIKDGEAQMVKAWEFRGGRCCLFGRRPKTFVSVCSDDIIFLLSCVSDTLLSSALLLISH